MHSSTKQFASHPLTWVALASISLALPAQGADTCDRKCLKGFADNYVAAMLKHDPSSLPLTKDFKMTQDTKAVSFNDGVWQTAVRFYSQASQTQYVMDSDSGQVGYMGILNDGAAGPAFFALRLKVVDQKIAEAEMLVTHNNDATPFWPQAYLYREAPYIREVPLKVRSTRQQLLDTTNTYWKISSTVHDGFKIPYSDDCWHFQNGMNTDWERPLHFYEVYDPSAKKQGDAYATPPQEYDGRIWTCAREATLTTRKWTAVRNTHNLVDVERGLVMSWNLVDIDPDKLPKGPRQPDGSRYPNEEGYYDPPSAPGADGMPGTGGFSTGKLSIATNQPYVTYHAYLFRIVNRKITREQVFQRFLPANTASPF